MIARPSGNGSRPPSIHACWHIKSIKRPGETDGVWTEKRGDHFSRSRMSVPNTHCSVCQEDDTAQGNALPEVAGPKRRQFPGSCRQPRYPRVGIAVKLKSMLVDPTPRSLKHWMPGKTSGHVCACSSRPSLKRRQSTSVFNKEKAYAPVASNIRRQLKLARAEEDLP